MAPIIGVKVKMKMLSQLTSLYQLLQETGGRAFSVWRVWETWLSGMLISSGTGTLVAIAVRTEVVEIVEGRAEKTLPSILGNSFGVRETKACCPNLVQYS